MIEQFRQWLAWVLYGWACWLAREVMGPRGDAAEVRRLRVRAEDAERAVVECRVLYEDLVRKLQERAARVPRTVVF